MAANNFRKRAIVAAMPLDPKQRHRLLMADRTGDVGWITAAIEQLLASDPDADLLDVEAAFREAAAHSYLVATAEGFEVIVGMQAWIGALAEAGVTEAENRAALEDTHPAVLPK